MFVRSRPNSPPRLDRFTILSSASYARASLAHAVDDLKAIEFFFFLLQQYSPSRVPFILFDSLSLKPFYITVEIFFFCPFLSTLFYTHASIYLSTPVNAMRYFKRRTKRRIIEYAIQFGTYASFTTEFYSARDNIALCICGAMRAAIRRPHFFVPFPRMHVRAHVFARRLPTDVSFAAFKKLHFIRASLSVP